MIHIIHTLDYEIHGNGDGCSYDLMVEPTGRLLRLFGEYGAKLTIMADIAEILKFREFAETTGQDHYHYHKITEQLQKAVGTGHDVQLQIHASYFNARHESGRWLQDWSEYDFPGLPPDRMNAVVKLGKEFLESELQKANPAYRCIAFRAANWAVHPSPNVVCTLLKNGIQIETSVFKYGRRQDIVNFDYSNAWSDMLPWPAKPEDICQRDETGALWEFPIYSENRSIGAFLTLNRIYRVLQSWKHRVPSVVPGSSNGSSPDPPKNSNPLRYLSALTRKHAWKADFNQCTGRQLIRALQRAERKYGHLPGPLPFVLMGHSKLFTPANEKSLRPFLKYVSENQFRYQFSVLTSPALRPGGS
jgi:hypothetical protein